MKEKNCSTCLDNDDGLCDRTGRLVFEDDTCGKWRDKDEFGRDDAGGRVERNSGR